jgi:hypothetical protein
MRSASHGGRRVFLMRLAVAAGSAAFGAGAAAQERGPDGRYKPDFKKRTREEVQYQNEPYLGRTCARCVLYQGDGVCVILADAVSPQGWCNQWVPNTMG